MDTKNVMTCILAMVLVMGFADSDIDKDREECGTQLVGLSTCLSYVGGDAKAPTPDCCTGLKGVLKNSKKCLCILVKDRNDPSLGLKINATLALGLPSLCHAPANISDCPGKYYKKLICIFLCIYVCSSHVAYNIDRTIELIF